MKKIFLMASMFVLAMYSGVFAHMPIVIPHDTSTTLLGISIAKPIEKSVAYYGSFDFTGDVDMYKFTLTASDLDPNNAALEMTDIFDVVWDLVVQAPNGKWGRRLHVGSLVPGCSVYQNVLPIVAIVGPKQSALPAYTGSPSKPSSVTIGSTEGVKFLNNTTQGPLWYEKFTYKSYYDQKKTDIIITEPGTYKLYIWNTKTQSKCGVYGDYVLEVGPVEVFGFAEIMDTLFWVTHIVNDGEIACSTCKTQLATLDGPNPSLTKMIADYSQWFQ